MRIPRNLDDMAPGGVRFAAFVALSIVLHVVTVIGSGPLDLAVARPGSASPARTELHATLVAGDNARSAAPAPDAEKPAEAGASRTAADDASARAESAGSERGLALPAPDKWYTASEVDVRAEPITEIRLHYPPGLTERLVGKVRVRLFIDE